MFTSLNYQSDKQSLRSLKCCKTTEEDANATEMSNNYSYWLRCFLQFVMVQHKGSMTTDQSKTHGDSSSLLTNKCWYMHCCNAPYRDGNVKKPGIYDQNVNKLLQKELKRGPTTLAGWCKNHVSMDTPNDLEPSRQLASGEDKHSIYLPNGEGVRCPSLQCWKWCNTLRENCNCFPIWRPAGWRKTET